MDIENRYGYTPLVDAVIRNQIDTVKDLIKAGANVNRKDKNNFTPLMYANSPELVKELLKAGANPNIKNKFGETALLNFFGRDSIDETNTIRAFVEGGANLNIKNSQGETPLMSSIRHGHKTYIKELMKGNVDVNIPNNEGFTPLMIASLHGNPLNKNTQLVKDLINAGANVNAKDKNKRPVLTFACDVEIAAELIKAGANTNNVNAISSDVRNYIKKYNMILPFLVPGKRKLPAHIVRKLFEEIL